MPTPEKPMPLTEIDGEAIIAARLRGEPERKMAKRLGIILADVRAAESRGGGCDTAGAELNG
jgi:hypothetical protein